MNLIGEPVILKVFNDLFLGPSRLRDRAPCVSYFKWMNSRDWKIPRIQVSEWDISPLRNY